MASNFLRIGHRGAPAYMAENTLSSLQAALDCRVDMVEVDVRLTKDGQMILAHEPYLYGQDHKLKIKKHTLAELKHVCLPDGEVVATLDEALRFMKGRGLVNIDIKEAGYEKALVALIDQLKMEKEVMISSTLIKSLQLVAKLNPKLYITLSYPIEGSIRLYKIRPILWFLRRLDSKWTMLVIQTLMRRWMLIRIKHMPIDRGFNALIIRASFITPRLVDIVHDKQLHLYAYPADYAHEVTKLMHWGVDGIESNRPDILHLQDSASLAQRS